jgi:TfoX/Sxy family transcriptional regulator of competence genes
MASSKEYRDFILEQLDLLKTITCKPMMGEFLLYYNDILFGGIYDNRLLVKKTETNEHFNMNEAIPYETAKPMYMVDDVDNKELLKEIVIDTSKGLTKKK